MKNPSVDVTYAAQMKPGDLFAGLVDPDAPTTPVQPFAAAHRIAGITEDAAPDGRKVLCPQTGMFELTPVAPHHQVILIREGEPTAEQVARYLAEHGQDPAAAAAAESEAARQLAELRAAARLVTAARDGGALAAAISTLASLLPSAPAAPPRPARRLRGLWKTTAVFFSDYDPARTPIGALARDAEDGDSYCPAAKTVYVPNPLTDPDWDGTGFFGPHEDADEDDSGPDAAGLS
jgi:hypothetical protein